MHPYKMKTCSVVMEKFILSPRRWSLYSRTLAEPEPYGTLYRYVEVRRKGPYLVEMRAYSFFKFFSTRVNISS